MTLAGRPLRFLTLVLAGWLGWRIFMLWPVAGAPAPADWPARFVPIPWFAEAQAAPLGERIAAPPAVVPVAPHLVTVRAAPAFDQALRDRFALANLIGHGGRFVADDVELGRLGDAAYATQGVRLPPPARAVDRWQASAWLMTRGGTLPGAARLGGSQAGLLIRHALTDRIGGYGRITAPLEGRGAEAALGFDLRPGDAPLRLIAEHRFGLDGIEGGPALGAIAGIGPQLAGAGEIEVEAYGQAGVIWRDRTEPYGDGFVRVARPIAEGPAATLDLGLGAWAAAQRDAHRVDLGPSVGARIPIGGRQLRASIDWRERVAGDVRPGSGLALTLGADF